MANLLTILQELMELWGESAETVRGIHKDMKVTNNRVDEAQQRVAETEERVQGLEEATRKLLMLQAKLQDKLTDQEGRADEKKRIHGVTEGSEGNSTSMAMFIENLGKNWSCHRPKT